MLVMKQWLKKNRKLACVICVFLASLAIAWILYGLFGHQLLAALYGNRSMEAVNWIMSGRETTALENYYAEADRLLLVGTIWLVTVFVVVLVLAKTNLLVEAAFSALSFGACTLFLFYIFDTFPALIPSFHLNRIEYFAYKLESIPDPPLVYRNRPQFTWHAGEFFGDNYSPLYRVNVKPTHRAAFSTDPEGFAIGNPVDFADVAVIGDSFIQFDIEPQDSIGRRLSRISGLTVASFAAGGYGPFQYLELLKRYAVKKKPKYALFCFFEGNDLSDLRQYLNWKAGGDYYYFSTLSKPFLERYLAALKSTVNYIQKSATTNFQRVLQKTVNSSDSIHPDIAVLELGGKRYSVLFSYKNNQQPSDRLIQTPEWKELRNILSEFKATAVANDIVPIVLYIPIAAHIYAEHSTSDSGENWLRMRADQIAAKANVENAISALVEELRIELIDLTPSFEAAAREGKLLYYPFDTHWNSEGREVAAAIVAETLKATSTLPRIDQSGKEPAIFH